MFHHESLLNKIILTQEETLTNVSCKVFLLLSKYACYCIYLFIWKTGGIEYFHGLLL